MRYLFASSQVSCIAPGFVDDIKKTSKSGHITQCLKDFNGDFGKKFSYSWVHTLF